MKYCLACGKIYSNQYMHLRSDNKCNNEGFLLTEDTEVSDEMFYSFSEEEKDAYEQRIYKICKQSEFFNEKEYNEKWEKPYNYYLTYRFDKYEQLTGEKAYTKDNKPYIMAKAKRELDEAMKYNTTSSTEQNIPKCPTCQSTNIRKIGAVERGASIGLFGLFSRKINKTFKCGNCGYTW